jgi:uncharacterized protein YndB with AHSA1/START domain
VTEVRAQVDLDHPVELVWRALTEPPLLARWFVEADIRPRAGAAFRLRAPAGQAALAGFDPMTLAEVTAVDAPRELVMRWRSDQMQTLVTWSLEPRSGGCRLTVTQVGFLGVRGTERRAALKATYERLYGERLPAVLAELAGGPPASLPPLAPPVARTSRVRNGRWLAVAGVAAVVAAIGTALSGLLPARTADPVDARPGAPLAPAAQPTTGPGGSDGPDGSTDPLGTPGWPGPDGPGHSGTAPSAGPAAPGAIPGRPAGTPPPVAEGTTVAPPPGSAPSPAPPVPTLAGPAVLSATYRTIEPGVLGLLAFRGGITVTNSGGTAASGWAVALTLPAPPTTASAPYVRNGTTYTFSGGRLAPGQSVSFTYDLLLTVGSGAPTACTIGSTPCAGV